MSVAAPAQAIPADFKAKADALLKQSFPDSGPGAAVIVTDDGKIVYEGGQGLADVSAKTKITPHTVFRLGSITKQFSAAIMLQLVAEGKLSLDDPLSKHVPGYAPSDPRVAAITARQALSHSSGLGNAGSQGAPPSSSGMKWSS